MYSILPFCQKEKFICPKFFMVRYGGLVTFGAKVR